jgi:membrane-associated phospholipid phosphatase
MKPMVPVLHPEFFDSDLKRLDLGLLGMGSSLWERSLMAHPYLTDLLSLCYLGLFVWLVGLILYHSWLRRALYQRFMLGLTLVYIGGFLGYLLFPAIGPRFAYPQEWTWLQGGWIFQTSEGLINRMGSQIDVFPSLHGALSGYLAAWQYRHDRRSLVWGLPLTLAIWISTLFLGFHYFPDLVSGGLLALASAWAAPRIEGLATDYRHSFHPPLVWLLDLTEGKEKPYGRLAERLSELQALGMDTVPGFLCGGEPFSWEGEPLRMALRDLGGGPFWLRPSVGKANVGRLGKPMTTEQVMKALDRPPKRFWIVQNSLQASAWGTCRAFPPGEPGPGEVRLKVRLLPKKETLSLALSSNSLLLRGWMEIPMGHFPKGFPLSGYQLFELAGVARKLAARWGRKLEVEWALVEKKIYVLDAYPEREK